MSPNGRLHAAAEEATKAAYAAFGQRLLAPGLVPQVKAFVFKHITQHCDVPFDIVVEADRGGRININVSRKLSREEIDAEHAELLRALSGGPPIQKTTPPPPPPKADVVNFDLDGISLRPGCYIDIDAMAAELRTFHPSPGLYNEGAHGFHEGIAAVLGYLKARKEKGER